MAETGALLSRALRSARSLQQSGLLAPVLGLAALGGSMVVMNAVAAAYPEAQGLGGAGHDCNPLRGDFGCGHGLGCACHLLPPGPAQG